MFKNKFVAITGIDGSGKDYVAEHLHRADPGSYIVGTPLPPFTNIRLELDSNAIEEPSVHYFFYLSSVIYAGNRIRKMLMSGNVYCARYLLDTVVYHRAMGLQVGLNYASPIYCIPRPDVTVFLTVSEGLRQRRIKSRGKYSVGDKLVDEEALRNSIYKEYSRLADQFIAIDNSERNILEVIAEIRNLMDAA